MSRTEVLFYKGLKIFEDDICIENILRSIHKLQAAVAAIVEDNQEVINNAKTLYFANQIIYRSTQNERKMRFNTDFLEYLRFSVASKITYNLNEENGNGQFVVNSKRTKIEGSSIKKVDIEDKIAVSKKMMQKKSKKSINQCLHSTLLKKFDVCKTTIHD